MTAGIRYGSGAIWLHWMLALAIAGQLGLGFAMPPGPAGFALFQLHKSIGIAILALTIARIAWRLLHPAPLALERGWQARLVGIVHVGLYAFMLLAPLTGWALVSTAKVKVPTVLFGIVPLPHLPISTALAEVSEQSHEVIAWVGIALIALHVAGALRHQFILRDGTLARMAPLRSPGVALGLLPGALSLFALPFALPRPVPTRPVEMVAIADEAVQNAPHPVEQSAVAASASPEQEETSEPAPPPQWTIAPGGSLRFSVGNGSDTISGQFTRWSGKIAFDPDNPESAALQVDVELASASVGDATQDSMLHGEEFLDTGSGARATWRSTSVRRAGQGYAAQGVMTLRGKSHPVPLRFSLSGEGNRRRAIGRATIDRSAFGIGQGEAGAALAPQVNVEFSFAATKN